MSVNNSLVKSTQSRMSFTAYLTNDAVKNQINSVLGGKDGQRFISSIVSAVTTNPALAECSNASIVSAALLGESLKLSPSPQLAYYYMVPFKDTKNGRTVATFVLSWRGMVQLAIRSGQYERINVVPIKEGELIKYDPMTEEIEVKLIEDDEIRENTETIGYFAYYALKNGFKKSMYWSKKKVIAHAERYSKGYKAHKGFTFWEQGPAAFDQMACKTLLRQLLGKYGIMSIEMQTAFENDNAYIHEDGKPEYVDSEPLDEPIAAPAPGIEITQTTAPNPEPTPDPVPSPIMPEPQIPESTIPEAKAEAKPERKARTAAKTAAESLFG